MNVFEIKTSLSDYPYLVIADDFADAVSVLHKEGVFVCDIVSVARQEQYKKDKILIKESLTAKEVLKEEVLSELQQDMPKWHKMPAGAAGGGERDVYLIRSSAGNYFTSPCIAGGGEQYYLKLDSLEQLPGLPKEK